MLHYDRGVHCPGVSPAGSNSAWARGACYPRTAAHAAESNTTGAQGGGGMPSRLSPPVAARAQLNVSDDMTRAAKMPIARAAALSDMVMPPGWSLGFAIAVQ